MSIILTLLLSVMIAFSSDEFSADEIDMLDIDSNEVLTKKSSLINWNEIDVEAWLDFKKWKEQRAFRDKNPYWKVNLRETMAEEKIAIVIGCVGQCKLLNSKEAIGLSQGSSLFEGDEIETLADSAMWIALSNGSIMRLSSHTMISLNEVNIAKESSLINIRLSKGHIYYQERVKGEFSIVDLAETDPGFYPLKTLEANREYFARKEFQALKKEDKRAYRFIKNPGFYSQYNELNQILSKESSYLNHSQKKVFIFTPNLSFQSEGLHFDLSYNPGFQSHIQFYETMFNIKKTDKKKSLTKLKLRDQLKDVSLKTGVVYQVNATGDLFTEGERDFFKFSKIQTKRIPTIHLAREIYLRREFPFLFLKQMDSKKMALDFKRRFWADLEIDKRISFLFKMIHKREKKNLPFLISLFSNEKNPNFKRDLFVGVAQQSALYTKRLRANKRQDLLSYNDLEYYIWVFNNGKI